MTGTALLSQLSAGKQSRVSISDITASLPLKHAFAVPLRST